MSFKTFFSSVKKDLYPYLPWFRKGIKIGLLIFFCSSIFFVVFYRFVRPPVTPLMIVRSVEQAFHFKNPSWTRHWVSIEDISPYAIYAVMAAEDNKFVSHFGFDVTALQEAIEYNLTHKGTTIGGSTISQQTAKNVFLWPQRDILKKGIEAYFTLLMEAVRGKERIMEVYLNVIEFGNGIYGIDAAAAYYFHTTAKKLTSYQASLLAAILPNPRYYQQHLYGYRVKKRRVQISAGINRVAGDRQTRTFVRSVRK